MLVRTEAFGLAFIQNHPKTLPNDMSLITNGLMEAKPDTSFWATVANLKSVPVRIQKSTVVGIMLHSPRVTSEVQILEKTRDHKESTE